jgi:dephospho-CoA kinase
MSRPWSKRQPRANPKPDQPGHEGVLAIGCTGGIGAGKSTVAALLRQRGAIVVDADALARTALEKGSDGLRAVASRFGTEVLNADGSLDRAHVARIVFRDSDARKDLEAIVHPVVEQGIRDVFTEHAGSDAIVIIDVALLAERQGRERYGLDGVIVVDADEETCRERLKRDRGMRADEITDRMATQADRFDRLAIADFAILNVGTSAELEAMVQNAWTWITQLREELGR